jgi:hypothetical protein
MPVAKPNCLIWYPGDSCDQLLQQYRQVEEQRQEQEWQTSVTARYERQIVEQQQQIADQQARIMSLQSRIDSQTMDALRSEASTQAFLDAFRRLARSSTRQEQSRAASA